MMRTSLWVGEQPQALDLGAMALAGFALAGVTLALAPAIDWCLLVLAVLAWDIGAGLVSNATAATREAWRRHASKSDRYGFMISHLTVYPIVLYWLASGDLVLTGLVCAFLLAKVILFISGQRPHWIR